MSKKSITFKIEEEIKKEAENIFSETGIDMNEALTIFVKKAVKERGISFEIRLDVPTEQYN